MMFQRYKTGYLYGIFEELKWEDIHLIQRCKEKCEKLILGIPTDQFFLRIKGKRPMRSFEEQKEIFLLMKAIDEVIPVNKDNVAVCSNYTQLKYDCLFCGSEYGNQYELDVTYLKEQRVDIISLFPEKIRDISDDLLPILEKFFFSGKIVLFGTGKYFDFYMQKYGEKFPPVYAVDNDSSKWKTEKRGILIEAPDVLQNENTKDVLVILCCKEHQEIKRQLLDIGAFDYRTLRRESRLSAIEEYASLIQMEKKYKRGYLCQDFSELDENNIAVLEKCKKECEKIIIGLPSDDLILRMTGDNPQQKYEEKKAMLESLDVVDEIISVDIENISVRNSYKQVSYDVYFYGSEYGNQYQEDKSFLLNKEVAMISIMPERLRYLPNEDPMYQALRNAICDRKVILFGTGRYFEYYMQRYGKDFPPEYAVDNNSEKWNTEKNGIFIQNPNVLEEEDPEKVIVVLCNKKYQKILKQLRKMGKFDYRTMLYNYNTAIIEEYAVTLQEEKKYMEKAHRILKKLIIEFDAVCKKYDLHYYVIGGSLIGVVRHEGFIPWDDDVDVAMFRKDYEILKEKAGEIWENDSDFLFLDYDQFGKGVFYDFLTRIVYMKEDIATRLFKKVEGKARPDIQNKLVMDIYVMENADSNERTHKIVTTLMKAVYALAIGHRAKIDYSEYAFLPKAMFICVKLAVNLGKLIPVKVLFWLYERLRGYAKNKDCADVFESNNGAINYMPWRYNKKIFGEGKYMPMCGQPVMVPDDCDGLLKAKGYGDYMSFPPSYARKPSHSSKAKGIIW